jgi:hypothetical protein
MSDRLVLPFMALAALLMIALALAWPQGLGRRSAYPFGHALAPLDTKAAPIGRPLALQRPS